MEASTYVVLIGDLSRSRKAKNRRALQQVFAQQLTDANQLFANALISRLAITVGDEYQGVFRDPASALRAAITIAEGLEPARLHHGIGIGKIATAIDKEYPGRMDGPAFHRARAATQLSQKRRHWMTVNGFSTTDDELLTWTLSTWQRLRESWTKRQREVIDVVQKSPDQSAAAQRLRVQPSSVTDVLQAAKYHEVVNLKAALIAWLGNHQPHPEVAQ